MHIRHLWGVARHRLPMTMHTMLQQLILDDRLEIIAGRLLGMKEQSGKVHVSLRRRRDQQVYEVSVGRVINCTGPTGDITRMQRPFMQNLVSRS
jgi:uncharacterized NAD(P)/FAD-binding protein YdhS